VNHTFWICPGSLIVGLGVGTGVGEYVLVGIHVCVGQCVGTGVGTGDGAQFPCLQLVTVLVSCTSSWPSCGTGTPKSVADTSASSSRAPSSRDPLALLGVIAALI